MGIYAGLKKCEQFGGKLNISTYKLMVKTLHGLDNDHVCFFGGAHKLMQLITILTLDS